MRSASLIAVAAVALMACAPGVPSPTVVPVAVESQATPLAPTSVPKSAPTTTPVATVRNQAVLIPTAPSERARDFDVEVLDDLYSPAELTVDVGQTVVWRNFGEKVHDVVSPTDAWYPVLLTPGGRGTLAFNTPGTFEYTCSWHNSMLGRISVR